MGSKLLVIIASGDREKALAGMMYARNVIKYEWLDNVKVVFFGPSERLVAEDAEVSDKAEEIAKLTDSLACKAISDRDDGVSEKLVEIGIKVDYIGDVVSNLIKDSFMLIV